MTTARPRFRYATATSLDGFIADERNDLQWLFDVPGAGDAEKDFAAFLQEIGAQVQGSTTYEWLLEHEPDHTPDRPTFVFTSRDLPRKDNVRFLNGSVEEHLPAIVEAAGEKDVWIVGGGDLAGQFAEAGALDEIAVSIAPVALGAGAPLLPRRFTADRLELIEAKPAGQFIAATFRMR